MPESDFQQLVALCRSTHSQLQGQAARSINLSLVVRNWLFGWYIVEFEGGGAEHADLYGRRLFSRLAADLKSHGLKGISPTNLRKCRAFYQSWGSTIELTSEMQQAAFVTSLSTLVAPPDIVKRLSADLAQHFRLGWSHYVTLLSLSDPNARRFYEIEAATNSWSVRELERQMGSALYERLALSRDKAGVLALAAHGQLVSRPADVIKDPFVLEFLGLEARHAYSEHELETAIIDKLEYFLLELGKGFLFEARQRRFTFDNDHFYVDLVFYNRLLRCYVLIDLKIDTLRHQDLGQMQMYVNYFDRHVKLDDEAPTIGILLCPRKNDAVVKLTLPTDSNIYASKYQLYLPSTEDLQKKLVEWVGEMEG